MKLYEVTIDNNPGAWKSSGFAEQLIVLAESVENAIKKVKFKWGLKYSDTTVEYGFFDDEDYSYCPYTASGADFTVKEIKIDGYSFVSIREEKLMRLIDKD